MKTNESWNGININYFIYSILDILTFRSNMNCWHCQEELIWGGDHDTEDNEEYDMVSNLSCPNCHCFVEVYHPSESLIKEYKDHEDANESE
jgi:hypothetical protein